MNNIYMIMLAVGVMTNVGIYFLSRIIQKCIPENILSSPEVKRKQCGGDIYYAHIRA
jgi:hypothetical protein